MTGRANPHAGALHTEPLEAAVSSEILKFYQGPTISLIGEVVFSKNLNGGISVLIFFFGNLAKENFRIVNLVLESSAKIFPLNRNLNPELHMV